MIQDSLTHSDTISFAQAKHLLDTEPDCLLFDVREEEEFITGHPVEAELFTLDTIDAQTAELRIPSKDTPVLVYCRSGATASLPSCSPKSLIPSMVRICSIQ